MALPAPLAVVALVAAVLSFTLWQLFCQKTACWPTLVWLNQFLHLEQVVLSVSIVTAQGGCCGSMALELLSSVVGCRSEALVAGVGRRRVVSVAGCRESGAVVSSLSTKVFRGSALLCRRLGPPLPVLPVGAWVPACLACQ